MPGMRIRKQQQQHQAAVGNRPVGVMEEDPPAPLEASSTTTTTTITPLLSDDIRLEEGAPLLTLGSSPLESTSLSSSGAHAAEAQQHLEVSNDVGGDGGGGNAALSFRRLLYLLTSPLTDDQGRQPLAIVMGLLSMALGGILLGILLPKSSSLPSQVSWLPSFISYRTISSCIGYTYFLSWSTSFYPQLVSNFRRKTTAGLSADFCVLNVLGFSCYTAYNVALYTSPMIRRLYHERYHRNQHYDYDNNNENNDSIPVQSNDVAFAVHALLVSSITLFQIGYYNGFRSQQRPSKVIGTIIIVMLTIIISMPIFIIIRGGGNREINHLNDDESSEGSNSHFFHVHHVNWLDYLYVLSTIKVIITLIKYMPQVVLNCHRQSTIGWSIWQILLDMSGGILSDLQLVLDCAAIQDWTGITGNLAKLVLGSTSIVFDLIFFLQHYVLYKSSSATSTTLSATTTTTPLLSNSNSSYEQQAQTSDNEATTVGGGENKRDTNEAPIHSFV